jgi:hypothetical protein
MGLKRTYAVVVGDRLPIVVMSEDEMGVYKEARKRVGAGERERVKVTASQTLGRSQTDLREFSFGPDEGAATKRTVRALNSGDALEIVRQTEPAVTGIGSSHRISDAQLVVEAAQAAPDDFDIETVARSIGMKASYVADQSSKYESSTPEHYELEDGSVLDTDAKAAHHSLTDWMSDLAEAAHEKSFADFHAGDSGFRDPGADVARAHEDRRELRSMDRVRPSLSTDAPEPASVEAPGVERDGVSH